MDDSVAAPGESPLSGGQPARESAPADAAAPDSGPESADGQRDPRLAEFAEDGAGDTYLPGPELAAMVAELSGPEWRCAGATDDELIGLLGRWDAIGSWAEAGKLGVVRELLRRRAHQGLGGGPSMHGDLPDRWDEGLRMRSAPRWRSRCGPPTTSPRSPGTCRPASPASARSSPTAP